MAGEHRAGWQERGRMAGCTECARELPGTRPKHATACTSSNSRAHRDKCGIAGHFTAIQTKASPNPPSTAMPHLDERGIADAQLDALVRRRHTVGAQVDLRGTGPQPCCSDGTQGGNREGGCSRSQQQLARTMGSRSSGVVAMTARNALVSMPEISRRCREGRSRVLWWLVQQQREALVSMPLISRRCSELCCRSCRVRPAGQALLLHDSHPLQPTGSASLRGPSPAPACPSIAS